LFFLFKSITFAGGFSLDWNQVLAVLDKDGKAQISYIIRWNCRNVNFHGFYFEVFQEEPFFDKVNSYAVDDKGKKYSLDIKKLSQKKYDIVLANGQAFVNGQITYFFRYNTDLQKSGNLTQTMAGEKKLAVFNWAPVQWDDSMEHQDVTVVFPIVREGLKIKDRGLEKYNFRTEKYVNERYLIDYPETPNSSGEKLFAVRFYKKNISKRFHFQIQVCIDAVYFNLKTMACEGLTSVSKKSEYARAGTSLF